MFSAKRGKDRSGNKGAWARELALLKPMGWMAGIGIGLLIILVVYLGLRGGSSNDENPIASLTLAEDTELILGQDVILETASGITGAIPIEDFHPFTTARISLRQPELQFKSDFTLSFVVPPEHTEKLEGARGVRLEIHRFDPETELWTKLRALAVRGEPNRMQVQAAQPGIYGLGVPLELKDSQAIERSIDETAKARALQGLPNWGVWQSQSMAWAFIGRPTETGWEKQTSYRLVLDRAMPLVPGARARIGASTPDQAQPAWVSATQQVKWYVGYDLTNLGPPVATGMASEADAFSYTLDETWTAEAGELHIVYELVDPLHGDLIAKGWMPIRIAHTPPKESPDEGAEDGPTDAGTDSGTDTDTDTGTDTGTPASE